MKFMENLKKIASANRGTSKGFISLSEGIQYVMLFGVFIITIAIVGSIVAGVQGTQTAGTTAFSATSAGLAGLLNLSNLSPVIGLVLGAVIVLGLLIGSLYRGAQ